MFSYGEITIQTIITSDGLNQVTMLETWNIWQLVKLIYCIF